MLPDGVYDAIVVDAEASGDDRLGVDLAILSGEHRGEVVAVRAPAHPTLDDVDLLGIPATLVVRDGNPAVSFEP